MLSVQPLADPQQSCPDLNSGPFGPASPQPHLVCKMQGFTAARWPGPSQAPQHPRDQTMALRPGLWKRCTGGCPPTCPRASEAVWSLCQEPPQAHLTWGSPPGCLPPAQPRPHIRTLRCSWPPAPRTPAESKPASQTRTLNHSAPVLDVAAPSPGSSPSSAWRSAPAPAPPPGQRDTLTEPLGCGGRGPGPTLSGPAPGCKAELPTSPLPRGGRPPPL